MSNQAQSVYTVARELLTEDIELSNDDAVAKIKARGVTKPESDIRKALNNTRSELRRRKKGKTGPAKAKSPSPYTLTRELLTADPSLSNDELFDRIKTQGVTRTDADIRTAIRHTRSDILHNGPKPAPVAARIATEPKANSAPAAAASAPVPSDEATLFAAIGQVNKTAQLCGGVTKARAIAEAIRGCGGIEAFLRRLDLVAEILDSETEL